MYGLTWVGEGGIMCLYHSNCPLSTESQPPCALLTSCWVPTQRRGVPGLSILNPSVNQGMKGWYCVGFKINMIVLSGLAGPINLGKMDFDGVLKRTNTNIHNISHQCTLYVHHQCSLNCKCNFIFNISIPPSLSIVKYSNGCTPDPSQYSLATEYLEGVFTPNIVTDWPQGPCLHVSMCPARCTHIVKFVGCKAEHCLLYGCSILSAAAPRHHPHSRRLHPSWQLLFSVQVKQWLGRGSYAYCWILPSHIRSWARGRSKLLRHSPEL